jgi:hypothetical protein
MCTRFYLCGTYTLVEREVKCLWPLKYVRIHSCVGVNTKLNYFYIIKTSCEVHTRFENKKKFCIRLFVKIT